MSLLPFIPNDFRKCNQVLLGELVFDALYDALNRIDMIGLLFSVSKAQKSPSMLLIQVIFHYAVIHW